MSNLPYTSGSLLFWMNPTARNILYRNSSITSVKENVTGNPILPNFSLAEIMPTWTNNVANGYPALNFSAPNQTSIKFPLPNGNPVTGTAKPITLMAVARCTDTNGGTCVQLGTTNLADGSGLWIFFDGGATTVEIDYQDRSGALDSVVQNIPHDVAFHLYTVVIDGKNVKLRIDGVEMASTPIVLATSKLNLNTISLGADVVSGENFTGDVAMVLCYAGSNDLSPEAWLKSLFNL